MPRPPKPRTQAYDLVIFDLDGTLVDTAPEIADAVNTYLASHDLEQAGRAEVLGWIGHGAHALLQQALASRVGNGARHMDVTDDEMAEFGQIYLSCCGRNSRVYDGVLETLDALRTRGVRLALVTNKEARFALPILAAHGLTASFDDIVCGDSLPTRKPDPLPVQYCLQRAGVAPARALLVGDSDVDIATARAAGVAIWAVDYGYGNTADIVAAQPDGLISDFQVLAPR